MLKVTRALDRVDVWHKGLFNESYVTNVRKKDKGGSAGTRSGYISRVSHRPWQATTKAGTHHAAGR